MFKRDSILYVINQHYEAMSNKNMKLAKLLLVLYLHYSNQINFNW